MRLLRRTEGGEAAGPGSGDTLRADAATTCGHDVEISGEELLRAVAAEARPTPADRPWVTLNMVASVDGAASGVEGRSASLSGPADRELFLTLRSVADLVLAGAGTIRAENYGAPRPVPGAGELRAARGQAPLPRLVIVSGRLRLDPDARVFQEATPETRPIVLTTRQAAAAVEGDADGPAAVLATRADIRPVGEVELDWKQAMRLLREEYGARMVLSEGGPTTNAQLLDHDLVDELCLSVAPLIIGGGAQRIVGAVPPLMPLSLSLDRMMEDQGFLLLRYLRVGRD